MATTRQGVGEIGHAGGRTKKWLVDGPDGVWSVWDFGDELTVHAGPEITDRVYARVPEGRARKMTESHRRQHVEDAIGAVHVAKLLNCDNPHLHLLWGL